MHRCHGLSFFCASDGDCKQHVLSTYEPLLSNNLNRNKGLKLEG